MYDKIIGDLADKVPTSAEDTYIGADGLKHCKKCNSAVEVKINVFDEERIVPCICKCRADELKREKETRERIELHQKIKRYKNMAFPESDLESWTFENDDGLNADVMNVAKNYVTNFKEFKKLSKGLIFHGPYGTGKTYVAASIANALLDKGIPVLMTNFTRIINTISGMYSGKQEYLDSLNQFDLLILDDLGVERSSEYMQENVFNIIDSRYRAGLPLIITTNLTLAEISTAKSKNEIRIYDRVIEMCHPIEVKGTSRRRKKVGESYYEINKLLGI